MSIKADNREGLSVFSGQPIVYVDGFDEVDRIVNRKDSNIKEYVVISESGTNVPASIARLVKTGKVKVLRIRGSGSWNSFFRTLNQIDHAKVLGQYAEVTDLMFISFHSAHVISAALKRHRAFSFLTTRELVFLSHTEDEETPLEGLDLILKKTPNMTTSVAYKDLSIEQRFALTYFEPCRYMKPVHSVESLELLIKGHAFYEPGAADLIMVGDQYVANGGKHK